MSVFDGLPPSLLDYVTDAQQLKQDHSLLESYSKQVSGVGLESLNESPAHRLIEQSLIARYGEHYKVGSGNEGLLLLAAVVAGGYVAYKKMMRAKNNPVLKTVAEADKKVEKTYNEAWLSGKHEVGGEVACGELSTYFAGANFGAMSGNIEKTITDLVNTLTKTATEATAAWKKLEPIIRNWVNAKSDDDKKKYYDEMKKAYPKNPFGLLAAEIKEVLPEKQGKGGKITALTESDYAKVTALLRSSTDALIKVDDLSEDMWMNLGFWDLFDGVDSDSDEADEMWDYGYAENIGDFFGRPMFAARNIVLDLCRGLETLIVNSFK
ncbi:hypothetical protein ACSA002_1820 [Salmonella phage vB_SalM_SA002]|nr:hypothetical protein ACSA002_1820 [Salmonella phage vB_SalM_SA002]